MESKNSGYDSVFKEVCEHGGDVVLGIVPCDPFLHPSVTQPSVVFMRDVKRRKTHAFSLNHGDSLATDKSTLSLNLSKLPNRKWVFDKKSFIQMVPVVGLLDANLHKFLGEGETMDASKFETPAHRILYRSGVANLNNVIPILKHQEMFDGMCDSFTPGNTDVGYLKENKIVIETLAALEQNGIHVIEECFRKHFAANIPRPNTVFSQYNIYTVTGRPSNHFDNVNYAALNKENGVRNCFTSRYGKDGKMVLIDYAAFHPRIICHLVKFPLAIDVDIYQYLGQMYFKRENLGDYEIGEAKKLTFRQLYGGVEPQFETIKYFARLKSFIDQNWEEFKKQGFVLTPIFKRKITNKHLLDPNPNKLFNYILQATESEIAIQALNAVNRYLENKRTRAVLYTYDSVLFDFHKDDGSTTLNGVMTVMKMGERFPIKVYAGDSYASVSQIYP